jgi:glucokinase
VTVAAIDIGGTWTKFGLIDRTGALTQFTRVPTEPPADVFLGSVFSQVEILLAADPQSVGLGVSVAGFIDRPHSMMIYNPNLPWLERIPIQATLAGEFDLPVKLEIDSNAAALGEFHFGAGQGCHRFLCLTIGTGIGGGFIDNGQLVRLTHECIGDVGHIILNPAGPPCSCGGAGCAEALAAAPALLQQAGRRATNLEHVPYALFTEAGKYIGQLAASLAAVFYPERIALAGGVCEASHQAVESARASFRSLAGDFVRHTASIVPARLGARAPLIGAACPFFASHNV